MSGRMGGLKMQGPLYAFLFFRTSLQLSLESVTLREGTIYSVYMLFNHNI